MLLAFWLFLLAPLLCTCLPLVADDSTASPEATEIINGINAAINQALDIDELIQRAYVSLGEEGVNALGQEIVAAIQNFTSMDAPGSPSALPTGEPLDDADQQTITEDLEVLASTIETFVRDLIEKYPVFALLGFTDPFVNVLQSLQSAINSDINRIETDTPEDDGIDTASELQQDGIIETAISLYQQETCSLNVLGICI